MYTMYTMYITIHITIKKERKLMSGFTGDVKDKPHSPHPPPSSTELIGPQGILPLTGPR